MNFLLNPGFSLFGLWDVKWYGVIIAGGMLAGILIALMIAKQKGYRKGIVMDLALVALPSAIIGARLYYVIFNGVDSFGEIFAIWNGGMAIYGGVIGGFIGVLIYCLIKKYSLLEVCDLIAPCLILGQCIGRWGNYVNQEAYGTLITDSSSWFFPHGVLIESKNFTPIAHEQIIQNLELFGGSFPDSAWFVATFFYESMSCLLIFVAMLMITKFINIRGIVVGTYLAGYGIVRSILEGLRADPLTWGGIRVSQVLSIILIVTGLAIIAWAIYKHFKNKKEGVPQQGSTLIDKKREQDTENPPKKDSDDKTDGSGKEPQKIERANTVVQKTQSKKTTTNTKDKKTTKPADTKNPLTNGGESEDSTPAKVKIVNEDVGIRAVLLQKMKKDAITRS